MKYASVSTESLQKWAQLNNVQQNGVQICSNIITPAGLSKGGGLISTEQHSSESVLLVVPQDLVLTKETVLQCTKTDKHFRMLIEALNEFVQTPRKALVLFLLYQMTISSPDLAWHAIGVRSPFTDQFCSLPKAITLPTFFSSEEREMLIGTSLHDALDSKMSSLEKEFELLRERTHAIEWCRKAWWDEPTGRLDFQDWLLADAIYRSRAIDLPRGVGDGMVPVLDMANHAGDERFNARFEVDDNSNVLLLVRGGKEIAPGEEITIAYGCGGASEMIFSYGFLEDAVQSAREMFLSLHAPEDDPLRVAKMHFAKEAPGVRIFLDAQGKVSWESKFVWWTCVNEEDGLDFELLQTTDGKRELQASWKGEPLNPDNLETTLMNDPRRDLFALRATVTIQDRVERQGEELAMTQEAVDSCLKQVADNRMFVYKMTRRLRELELNMLTDSYTELGRQKQELLQSRTVTEYLASNTDLPEPDGQREEDFS